MPAPTSSTPACAAMSVNVPSPLLRYRFLRPKSFTTYRSGQPSPIEVAPAATKAVAGIVLVEAGLRRNIAKGSVAIVAQHEIGRTIFGGVIRRGIFILIGALIIDVKAEINIQPAIAIVVGGRRASESSLRRVGELKRVGLEAKLAAALVQEQQRTGGAHHDQILAAVVVEIGENRAGGVFQKPYAG